MLQNPIAIGLTAEGWAGRNEHWISEVQKGAGKRKRRERTKEPLVLCGHGVSLRLDGGSLLIRNGRTHYPQDPETYQFFKGDLALPPRIVMLDGSGYISFDVLDWLANQRVPLVRINWQGNVVSVVGGTGFAADRAKTQWQVETAANPERRVAFAIDLIAGKIANSVKTLRAVVPPSPRRETALAVHVASLNSLKNAPPGTIDDLHGIEGRASAAYFAAWDGLPLHWKATARRPIPEAWRTIGPRSSLRERYHVKNAYASHPLNAMLNYGYAVLQSQLQIQAISEGCDPSLGIMHRSHRGSPAYILDLMEPHRPQVDAAILRFAFGQAFSGADFILRSDGVVRLGPQLASAVTAQTALMV